jgi:type III pantothenate kinase
MPSPTFLLIDIGNTRLKWATASSRGPILLAGEVATKEVTSAWVNALARKFLKQRLILASVVPKRVPAFRRAFSGRLVEMSATLHELGFSFQYPNPAEIGADRLAATVAAQAQGHYPAIIVACGTATAFTVLDAKGRFCGGVIAPGLQTQLAALIGATAQLPATKLSHSPNPLARSTREAIRAGVMLNFRGGVKEIINQLSKALSGRRKPHLLITGGNAHYLAGKIGLPMKLRPLLVFEGLRMIGLRTLTKTL